MFEICEYKDFPNFRALPCMELTCNVERRLFGGTWVSLEIEVGDYQTALGLTKMNNAVIRLRSGKVYGNREPGSGLRFRILSVAHDPLSERLIVRVAGSCVPGEL